MKTKGILCLKFDIDMNQLFKNKSTKDLFCSS